MRNSDHIQIIFDAVQGERDVRILYGVESGSRAWGLDAADNACFSLPLGRCEQKG